MTIASGLFKEVYENLGIDTSRLGCIMLDTEIIPIADMISTTDLYIDPDPNSHTQGLVSENAPHVTVLYGLMRSGPELKKHVDAVLSDWKIETVTIKEVSFFYSPDPADHSIAIIALVEPTPELVEGNSRLRLLPHIDTFPEYRPHITLAYVLDTINFSDYIDELNTELAGREIKVTGINYGD